MPNLFQNNLLCAGIEIGTQGSCHGDSGGPLMIKDRATELWTQIATVQGGIGNTYKKCFIVSNICRPRGPQCRSTAENG